MRIHITILAALLAAGSLSAQDATSPSAAMTLEQCRELALQSNKQLMISRARIQKAHYQNREAFAAYLPALDFAGGYAYNQKEISIFGSDQMLPLKSFDPKTGSY